MREQEARERLQAIRQYGTSLPAPFPGVLTLPVQGHANGVSNGHTSNGHVQPQTPMPV